MVYHSAKLSEKFLVYLVLLIVILHKSSAAELETICTEKGKFYRKPEAPGSEFDFDCSKYYLCLEGEEFLFKCSSGLSFDVERQTCEPKSEVNNCNITLPEELRYSVPFTQKEFSTTPAGDHNLPFKLTEPLRKTSENCENENEIECNTGECIFIDYVCNGYQDCSDGEDEEFCDLQNDPNIAKPCNTSLCSLPNCFCSNYGTEIPGNLDQKDVPQMVTISFDDALTFDNFEVISQVLKSERRNPNGCPIKATFFVSHYNNNYFLTEKVWREGHEIAVHSITHRSSREWWTKNATVEDWFDEMVGQANILHKYANILMKDINGIRVPFLHLGWNRQYLMMKEFGFQYDSSIVAPMATRPFWPYTLDYAIPHSCEGNNNNCPTHGFPGIWELPINPFQVDQFSCPLIYSCPEIKTEDEFYSALVEKFKKHYVSNRAPFQLSLQAFWIKKRGYLKALERFLDETLRLPNVWFVTNWQLIQWMRQPSKIENLNHFKEWQCKKQIYSGNTGCNRPNTCKVYSNFFNKQKYFYTCQECPKVYPWFRDEFGIA